MLQQQFISSGSSSILRAIAAGIILNFSLLTHSALASVLPNPDNNAAVFLFGRIESKDVTEIAKYISRSPAGVLIVHVDSRGGDWEAAMELGQLLRASQSGVIVAEDAVCFSSCVIILAGATTRIVNDGAKIGIHRPFSTATKPLEFKEAQANYRKLEAKTKSYLHEMNMPESLWDAIVSTPPENIRVLSMKELEAFRLSGLDPVLQEIQDANNARKYGISKEIYFARKNQVWPKCSGFFPTGSEVEANRNKAASKLITYWQCERAVLRGEK